MTTVMARLRTILQQDRRDGSPEYDPLVGREQRDSDDGGSESSTIHDEEDLDCIGLREESAETPFYWLEYVVFLLLGVAMLWAWYAEAPLPPKPACG